MAGSDLGYDNACREVEELQLELQAAKDEIDRLEEKIKFAYTLGFQDAREMAAKVAETHDAKYAGDYCEADIIASDIRAIEPGK